MTSSAIISVAIIAIAAFLSSIFRSDRLPRQWNIALALAAFALIVIGDVWLTVGFSGDARTLVTSLIVAGVALGGRELWGLLNYVEGATSPLQALVPPHIPVIKQSTPRQVL
jgi:hypothetical protein